MNFLFGIARNSFMKTILCLSLILSLCEFNGRANDVDSVAKTNLPASTDFVKYNREIRDACKWGACTNGIQLGVGIWGLTPFTVQTFLATTNSKGHFGPTPAPHGYRLGLSLQDADGKPVKRTKTGDALCIPVGWFMRRTMPIEMMRGVYGIAPGVPRRYDDTFNLLDCFNIETPGTYTLFIKGSLYWRKLPPPAEIIPIDIPETSVQVSVMQADLDHYKAVKVNVEK